MTITVAPRHVAVLGEPSARAFLAAPGFPLPDATAMRRVGSASPRRSSRPGCCCARRWRRRPASRPTTAILDVGCGWGADCDAARGAPWAGGALSGHGCGRRGDRLVPAPYRRGGCTVPLPPCGYPQQLRQPARRIPASQATLLPWEERFDRIVAFSLFTHLLPDAVARYLAEAARLCRPGGVLVATFFLLDDEARAAIADGRADRRFLRRMASRASPTPRYPRPPSPMTPRR